MPKVKYIKTKDNQIIVFSHLQQHSEFKRFNPVSAGFISFSYGEDTQSGVKCECYGESVSLNLKADVGDSELARLQIVGDEY